ncbi:MAG TPA: DEAD/DEAH box helicase [Saprospiraceae bacterium]|nr:DEAD/DEAH box helicase [Saprospiraceae bacterium]HMQ84364.1 DEAD/DEAH box helicase [Saprospiraceae bacterium]
MSSIDFFNQFKRQSFPTSTKSSAFQEIFFQINWDNGSAFLSVVNSKGKEIDTSYLNYGGAVRNLLRSLEQIKEKSGFVINWSRPGDQVYFAEYPFLIDALRLCDNVVDQNMTPLTFADTSGRVRLYLTNAQKEGHLVCQLQLLYLNAIQLDFQAISDQFLLCGDQIIEVPPMGANFEQLTLFNTSFIATELNLFLSLTFSSLDNLDLHYDDYKLVLSNDKIKASPCLIFEKVDENDSLYMRVGQSLPDLDFMVLDHFDLYRYAEINELERKINIRYIEQAPSEQLIAEVMKLLRKSTPKVKKAERNEILEDGNLLIIPQEVAANFIYQELPQLIASYNLFGAERLKNYKISTRMPKLEYSLSHNIDFFEGDVQLDFEGEKINLFDALSQYHKNRYIQLSDGSHALVNEAYMKRLERLFNKKGKKAQVSFFDLPLLDELMDDVARDKTFDRSRKVFQGFNNLQQQKAELPVLQANLRPYQLQGFKWLNYLHDNQLSGCLADDMGLGKTLQAIALLANFYPGEASPSLVVMPRSLLFNWESEVRRFAPQLKTYTFYGQTRDYEELRKAHLVFTTYAIMRNEIKQLKDEGFFYIILDESQNIKNLTAQTTKAALLLRGKHRLAISGTPIENNLAELYSLFHFLSPAMFGSFTHFNSHYLTPIQKDNDKEATRQLRRKIYPFVLRRLKKDVLADLPDKIEQTLMVEMGKDQKQLYEQRRQFYAEAVRTQIQEKGVQGAQFFVFQALNELRQIASIPEAFSDGQIDNAKLELLNEQLLDALANGHKALVFVNFLAAIESIGSRLSEAGIDYAVMTGATRDREHQIGRFQNDPECRVFLLTLKTGGVGLNLTSADTIFIFDPWWNVAAENQAIDRAHRIGQKNKVLAYKLIAQGTIEEKILQLQSLKKELFDNVIASDSASLKSLSEEDIKLLLGK